LGDRQENIRRAIDLLGDPQGADASVLQISSLYETEPVGWRDQPWFLNCVVAIETSLRPRQLLAAIQRIEATFGRQRTLVNGPRTLDIDILLYGSECVNEPDLVIPHPRMLQRRFVLEPLAEIAPSLQIPGTETTTVASALSHLTDASAVRKFQA